MTIGFVQMAKGEKMRLIDADMLKVKQQKDADLFIGDDTLSGKSRRDEALNAVANIVNAPTVDAVEVVRCKDCRWFENDGYHTNCQIMRFCVEAKDYCSRGERREDASK